MIDAFAGRHLWAERYDRDFTDIFKLQDELASKVVNSLAVKLLTGEEFDSWLKNMPSNIQFTEKFFKAGHYLYQLNREANVKAKQLYLSNPPYYEKSYRMAQAGQICGIIGLSLSGLYFFYSIIRIANM